MIEKAEAIVLKSKKFRDTSKIVTLYTREFGKITVIAKGSRSKNNRFGGSLEPISHIAIIFYKYENRELQYITQSNIINIFSKIRNDITKTMVALAILEIVNNVMHNEDRNPEFFQFILDTLISLDKASQNHEYFLTYFELHLASKFGFHPDFINCAACNREINTKFSEEKYSFSINHGSILCSECSKNMLFPLIKISSTAVEGFRNFMISTPDEITGIQIPSGDLNEMFSFIHKYLKNHISGMKDLKSLEIFSNIKQ